MALTNINTYGQGHKCSWLFLFFLEAADYIVEEPNDEDPAPQAADPAIDPDKPLISLSAITGIRTMDTM
jgi:hypothetical protein